MKLFLTTREIESWTAAADNDISNMLTSAKAITGDLDLPKSVRDRAADLAGALQAVAHEFVKLDSAIARENP